MRSAPKKLHKLPLYEFSQHFYDSSVRVDFYMKSYARVQFSNIMIKDMLEIIKNNGGYDYRDIVLVDVYRVGYLLCRAIWNEI